MRIWFDTEFIEDGKTIDLISIGLVREDGANPAPALIASAIREAQASARDEQRSTMEAYEACVTVARIHLAHIKPEVEAEIPTLCEIEESIWLQHKETMPICAIDMLAHAEKKIAIRSARDDALEEAAQLPILKHHQATAIRSLKSKG